MRWSRALIEDDKNPRSIEREKNNTTNDFFLLLFSLSFANIQHCIRSATTAIANIDSSCRNRSKRNMRSTVGSKRFSRPRDRPKFSKTLQVRRCQVPRAANKKKLSNSVNFFSQTSWAAAKISARAKSPPVTAATAKTTTRCLTRRRQPIPRIRKCLVQSRINHLEVSHCNLSRKHAQVSWCLAV